MRRTGIMVVIALGAAALSSCALRDPRDDYTYSRASDGLWGDQPFEIIDWNFPTSVNQGPIEAPKRIRLERTAIGVTWATRNPLPLSNNLAPQDAPPPDAKKADDRTSRAKPIGDRVVGSSTADREPRAPR